MVSRKSKRWAQVRIDKKIETPVSFGDFATWKSLHVAMVASKVVHVSRLWSLFVNGQLSLSLSLSLSLYDWSLSE